MNRKKRGLALLLCICMLFTLMPMAAFADGTSADVVYGSYDNNGDWKLDTSLGSSSTTDTNTTTGDKLTLSKTAKYNGNNQYEIELKVVTTATSTAATVLVIDTSGSMAQCSECGASNCRQHNADSRLDAAKKAAINFLKIYSGAEIKANGSLVFPTTALNRYVSIVEFADSSKVKRDWVDVSTSSGYQQAENVINRLSSGGGTNLDAGLRTANTQLAKDTVASFAAKNVIALTDGQPTYYMEDKTYGSYTWSERKGTGSSCSEDHLTATAKSATNLKDADGTNAKVYTICYGVANDKCYKDNNDKTVPTVGKFLKDSIATPAANGVTYAYNTSDSTDVTNAFNSIANIITSGIKSGTVNDGLPAGVSLVGNDNPTWLIDTGTSTWTLNESDATVETGNGKNGLKVGQKSYTYTCKYTVKVDPSEFNDDNYHPLNTETYFTAGNRTYQFPVPGVKFGTQKFDVTYDIGDHGTTLTANYTGGIETKDADNNVTKIVYNDCDYGSTTPTAPKVTPDDGYYFTGWDKEIASTVTAAAIYTAQYAEKIPVTFTGESASNNYTGSEQKLTGITVTGLLTGHTYSGLSYSAKGTNVGTYDGTFSGTLKIVDAAGTDVTENYAVTKTPGKLTITKASIAVTFTGESGSKPYTGSEQELTGITVTGLLTGHTYSGLSYSAKGTNVGTYDGTFSGTLKIVDAAGVDVTENYAVTKTPGTLTITPSTETIKVTITGNNDTKTYTGKKQSVEGYTWEVVGADKDQISVTLNSGYEAVAKGTAVDTYPMNLSADMFNVTSQNYSNIEIAIVDGWLKIEAKPYTPPTDTGIYTKIIVKITGNSASEVYDGTEKSVEGYTVEISDPRYTEKDFKFTGTAEAKGTFVGEYPMGLEADQFVNINRRFKNVEFIIVEDGVLTITARPITITAGSAEGWVTDCPITCDEWTSTPPAPGDTVVSVKITGVQNGPGSSPNVPSDAVIKNEAGKDVTGNYDITYVNGLLVAKDLLEKEDHFNYVIGYPDGSVQPNGNITRAEVATIFYRLLTDEARAKYTTTDNSFSDIKAGEWYTKAIATLENANIIGGYPDGTFKPNAPITRAEMATIIAKFANLDENGKSFTDIKGHWAQSYVELAAGNGWINGYEDGTFRPDKYITRAETFTMINRVLDRQVESADALLPTSQMNMWTDNLDPTQWYYMDVQEATNYHKCDRVNESKYETWTEKVPDIDWAAYQY